MPISRSHESRLPTLPVGLNEAAGCIYYMMELADTVGTRSTASDSSDKITDGVESFPADSLNYIPQTLRLELERHGRQPLARSRAVVIAPSARTNLQRGLEARERRR